MHRSLLSALFERKCARLCACMCVCVRAHKLLAHSGGRKQKWKKKKNISSSETPQNKVDNKEPSAVQKPQDSC